VHAAQLKARLSPHLPATLFGLAMVGLMVVWAVDNGGFDATTWYWGALVALAALGAVLVLVGGRRLTLRRSGMVAVALFAAYVGWSYLSIAWAQSPGDALQGSNRALLYLLVFSVMLALPWTPGAALTVLTTYAVGVGVLGIVLLTRLASDDRVTSLFVGTRLAAPAGYLNASAALFSIGALTQIALAARRELPGPVRGLLLALACGQLQLALIVESRGWLFTLPLVALIGIMVCADRLRVAAMATIPVIGALAPLHRLLAVYQGSQPSALDHAAARAGQAGLLICGGVFVLGTILAWGDTLLLGGRSLTRRSSRAIGTAIGVLVLAGAAAGGTIATHGRPFAFISREWHGLSHPQVASSSSSHFADVGSDRYDFWRVAVDAFLAHPIGGLGQDNYADYYVIHRRTAEEPAWTHSIELRLLTHTGVVGFALFVGFLVAALRLAIRGRRRGDAFTRAICGICLLALADWLVHGSIDWFWELPALSGPALGFLGIACSLGALAPGRTADTVAVSAARGTRRGLVRWPGRTGSTPREGSRPRSRGVPGPAALAAGALATVAGAIVLGIPYLSAHEVALATNVRFTNPSAALRDLSRAASLNPLDSEPGRLGGAIALQNGDYRDAQQRFRQSIEREPGGWFSWLGAGLAASALRERQRAHRDFQTAYSINDKQPAIIEAGRRLDTSHPLTSAQAFKLLVLVQ
jgi:O-Antigen ligase